MGPICPLSGWLEFAGFGEDFGESIGELIEALLRKAVRQRSTEHLKGMLGEQQRIDDTVQSSLPKFRSAGRAFTLPAKSARTKKE